MKVVVAGTGFDQTAVLLKPAILYADQVTIYSPAASLLDAVQRFASVSGRRERALVMFQVMDEIPDLQSQMGVDPEIFSQLRDFLRADARAVRRQAAAAGALNEIQAFYDQLDGLSSIWEEEFPRALEQIESDMRADQLLVALRGNAVSVADLSTSASESLVAETVNAALGETRPRNAVDDIFVGFMSKIVEILSDNRSFPLLDADASGLVRSLEQEGLLVASELAERRGTEISSASGIMGFLPSFPDLPMDEVLDLRRVLATPVRRFRTEWASISRDFSSRPIDPDFDLEVHEAWRVRVEPALTEIRESLADHGLLRETRSVVLGDPRRIIAEAGAVFAAGYADLPHLSTMMTTALAAILPTADVLGRAIGRSIEARAQTQRHPFYFLHRLGTEAERRST